jgi:NAD(P)-dependent dehydrogenase (short-subunit alcohol dehydrogenase family)
MNLGLDGRVAVVTGAAGGLGAVICRALAEEGTVVVASDVHEERLVRAVGGLNGVEPVVADVTAPDGAAGLVGHAAGLHGRLDALVAAAGLYQSSGVDAVDSDEWDRLQDVNLKGTFLVAQAALRVMIPAGRGAIVTLGSIAGQVGGIQSGAAYATTKAGVLGLTKTLARHAGPHGVRVNCVSPGFIDAGMSVGMTPEDRRRTVAMTPLGRAGTADEVADAVVWLASDASSFVTGAHVDVNGGLFMA